MGDAEGRAAERGHGWSAGGRSAARQRGDGTGGAGCGSGCDVARALLQGAAKGTAALARRGVGAGGIGGAGGLVSAMIWRGVRRMQGITLFGHGSGRGEG